MSESQTLITFGNGDEKAFWIEFEPGLNFRLAAHVSSLFGTQNENLRYFALAQVTKLDFRQSR